MSNKAYVYDPITREFVGVARLDRDPLGGGFLLPANATYTRPELMDGKAAIYDSKSDKWTQVTDLRGIEVYNVDGGHAYVVEPLGDLPDSVTTVKPDPPVGKLIDRFKAESGEWLYRDDYTGVVVYNTSNGGAVTLTATDKVISEGYTTKQRPSDAYNWDTKKQDWVLDKAKQALSSPIGLTGIALGLIKGFSNFHPTLFQFNLYQRQTVYKNGHIVAALLTPFHRDLVGNLKFILTPLLPI